METRTITTLQPSLEELKRHLRITADDLDQELTAILKGAIMSAEHEISTVISASSFVLTREFARSIKLRWPVTGVTSVKVDGDAVDASKYSYDEKSITFAEDVEGSNVEVAYTAGLSAAPDDIKSAVLLLAGSLFNNPTDRPEERDRTTARNLLRPYRTWGHH